MLLILGILGGLVLVLAAIVLIARLIFDRNTPEKIAAKYKGSDMSYSVQVKKYPEANLEKYRSIFLRTGLIFSLGLVILAFSWTTYERTAANLGEVEALDEFEIEPPQTQREPPPPPPPPPPEIKVVEDEEIIEEEPEVEIEEIEEETEIEIPEVVEEVVEEPEIFTVVEEMPEFPGGDVGLAQYLAKISYPAVAIDNEMEGVVYVRFVVDQSGKVTNVEMVRGQYPILNDAAVAHIKRMPAWKPGKQRGKPVKVQYVVPIKFILRK